MDNNIPESEDDALTDPLVGLCRKPMHLMSDEEKRLHVVYIQQLRQSFQTFKSEVEKVSQQKSQRKVDLTEMDEIL